MFVFAALAVAACGGGGGGGTVPSASTTPTTGPVVVATTVPVGGSSAGAVTVTGSNSDAATFSLPQLANGASANMTIAISPTLPNAVASPSARRLIPARPTKPSIIGANVTALDYISVVMDGTVGASSAPTVQFKLASSIGAAQQTYLLLWDPFVSGQQGWIVLLGPGVVSGSANNVVTFTGVPTAQTYYGGAQYVYALVTTSSAVPTATPNPTAAQPAPTTTPAYCASYATASPDAQLGGGKPVPLIFNDKSGLNGDVVLYVTDTGQNQSGLPASQGATTYARALSPSGQWVTPNPMPVNNNGRLTLTPIAPIPLKCFPGSLGYTGQTFKVPVTVSGLLYVAYAPTPAPGTGGTTAPDPFKGAFGFIWSSAAPGYGIEAPSIQYLAGFAGGFVPTPWDVVEYCTTVAACAMDTTQENRVGLPLLVSQGANTVGFGPGAYQSVLQAFQTTQTYDVLPSWITWGSTTALARIIAPGSAGAYGFPQDWWYNPNNYMYQNAQASALDLGQQYYYPGAQLQGSQGYIGYLLQQYNGTPQLYSITGTSSTTTPTTNDDYCVSSDGIGNFTFTEVGALGTPVNDPCAATPAATPMPGGNTFTMNAKTLIEGNPGGTSTYGYCNGSIFNMAASGAPDLGLPATLDGNSDFYLWKAMVVDIARGMAAQSTVTHPYSGWNTGSGPAAPNPVWNTYWKDPVYDQWAYILHKYMYNNKAYALQYDELGGMSTSFNPDISGNTPLTITVQQIPTGGGVHTAPTPPASVPWPVPPAEPCPT